VVSMIELTNVSQQKEEPIMEYIHQWRNLSLNYKDWLTKFFMIDKCVQGMHWGQCYILQGIKLKSFKELATQVHDMELSIAASESSLLSMQEPKRNKPEGRRFRKCALNVEGNRSLVVNYTIIKVPIRVTRKIVNTSYF